MSDTNLNIKRSIDGTGRIALSWTVVLLFPLPTWNRVLAMNYWQRKRLRDLTDQLVSWSIHIATGSRIQTDCAENMSLMPSSQLKAYCQMIRPSTLKASRTSKSKSGRVNRNKHIMVNKALQCFFIPTSQRCDKTYLWTMLSYSFDILMETR